MTRCQSQILRFASLSVVIALAVSLAWYVAMQPLVFKVLGLDGAEQSLSMRLAMVFGAMVFVAVAVVVMSFLVCRVQSELDAKDQLLRKKMADQENFAADVAHELRTPLAVLRANLDTLDHSDTVHQFSQDVARVSRIVDQVMAKSRVENIHIEDDEMADLSEVCSSMVTFLAPMVIKEGRTIELVGADHPVVIKGNAFALEQAVRNLVENSIKYSARGSTITVEVSDTPYIRVTDRGRGVPLEEREAIFERFHRADRRGQGSGLGLSIVRRVAETHGGKVTLDDAPGGGAVFTVTFSDTRVSV